MTAGTGLFVTVDDNEDMTQHPSGVYHPELWKYVAFYVIWLALAVASVFVLLEVRTNLISWVALMAPHPSTALVIRQASLFIVGFVILVVMILTEHSLRVGLKKQKFIARLAQVIIILAIALGASYAFSFAMRMIIPNV